MNILGVDPGLVHTGWGIITMHGSTLKFTACGAIHPSPKSSLSERLHTLHVELEKVIAAYRPDTAAIEQTFVSVNAASTLKLGNARGALLLSLAIHHLEVAEYSATMVKKSVTGSGRADKGQIERMVRLLLPTCTGPASADAMDALAVAITHAHHARTGGIIFV